MTLIAVVRRVNDHGDEEIGLAADLVMSPFRDPSLMRGSKIFVRNDFVWGVTGEISAIPSYACSARYFSDFVSKLTYNVREHSELIVIFEKQVLTLDLSKEGESLHNATISGEPLGWGCFKYPFHSKFGTYEKVPVADAVDYIKSLHALYGFENCDDGSLIAFPCEHATK